MRISVPSMGNNGLSDEISLHLSSAPFFTILDTESEEIEIIKNTSQHMGGTGCPPEIMHSKGVKICLCTGLGPRAISMFEELGIIVYCGAMGTIKDTIDSWKHGELQEVTDKTICKKHRH